MRDISESGVLNVGTSSSTPKPQKLKQKIIKLFDDLASRPMGNPHCPRCCSLLQYSDVTFFSPDGDRHWEVLLPICQRCDTRELLKQSA
jgi:hypothetical protein